MSPPPTSTDRSPLTGAADDPLTAALSSAYAVPAPRAGADPSKRPPRRLPVVLRVLVAPLAPSTWAAQIHLVLSFVAGLVIFSVMTVMFSVLAAVACTLVLIPVMLWLILVCARVIGVVERARFSAVLDVRIADPYPPFTGTFWDRVKQRFSCAAAWKEIAYTFVVLPMAAISFAVSIAMWAGSIALVALPLYRDALPDHTAHFGLFDVRDGWGPWIVTAAGALGILVSPWVSRGLAAVDVFVASNLLGRGVTADLEDRVDVLEATRSWAIEVAEAERRRIERDLHDGAQQRLVALAMELGRAKEKFDTDPDKARELIDHAHLESKLAIAELRDLARGIHPADLGDQGLPGAIPVLASRCPIPVEVELHVPQRPSPSIEGIAYFVVSESLANVTKHSGARRAGVRVTESAGWLVVEVGDDGIGGADPALGSGLRGLEERVSSVDGRFSVSSPIGGPTVIRVELPCAS